jgi:hypothetical protein
LVVFVLLFPRPILKPNIRITIHSLAHRLILRDLSIDVNCAFRRAEGISISALPDAPARMSQADLETLPLIKHREKAPVA